MTELKITLKDIFAEAQKLIDVATEKKITIATAESCTGGLIGAAITSIPGSSTPFKGGIIAYDNKVKHKMLDVPPGMIAKYGAVSRESLLGLCGWDWQLRWMARLRSRRSCIGLAILGGIKCAM